MATHDDVVLFFVRDLSYTEMVYHREWLVEIQKKLSTIGDSDPPRLELNPVEQEVVFPGPVTSFNGLSPEMSQQIIHDSPITLNLNEFCQSDD